MRRFALALLFITFTAAFTLMSSYADNWPAWRGPLANGVSNEKNLPVKWSDTENVTWKLPMPDRSGATPIIWGNTIFLNVAEGTKTSGALTLWAVERTNGSVLWKKPMGAGDVMMRKQNMSSPSPVTDGKTVWAMTGTGILKAFDFKGNELWMRDIQKDYGKFGLNWGYGSSPLLFEDSLYVPVLHGMKTDDPSYILRINKQSGQTIWKVERTTTAIRESPDWYGTIALLRDKSRTELILNGADCVTGHDAATGKELWRVNGMNPTNDPFYRTINSPVVMDGMIYAGARIKPFVAIRAGGSGDITATHRAWTNDQGADVPTPVTDGKYLYLVRDNGGFLCLDAKTGAEVYPPQRLKSSTYSSSPVLADGKLYVSNEDGLTVVVKAGPQFEVLAENTLDGYTLSSPAISDGQLFMRTASHLYCIGKRVKR